MTTTTNRLLTLFRLRRKRRADDDIERPEPDRFLGVFQDFIFGIVITAFLMMFAYLLMNGSMAEWIGNFLAHQDNSFTFDERFAAFTAVLILLVNMVVIFGVALTRVPDNEDVVDAIGDQSDELNERFAELENRVDARLEHILKIVDDFTPGSISPDDEQSINERMERML